MHRGQQGPFFPRALQAAALLAGVCAIIRLAASAAASPAYGLSGHVPSALVLGALALVLSLIARHQLRTR